MRARASPQVLSSKRPASNKGKEDRSSRSLSSLTLSSYVSRPALSCFVLKFERWRTNCGSNFRRERNVEKKNGHRCAGEDEDHLPGGAGLRPRRRASRKKFERAHPAFLLWSPPLSTRVIDGWGSFWPRLVHFALQRVPPSPSQTMHTRIGLIINKHSCKCIYLFS